jgi:hypothetical protein
LKSEERFYFGAKKDVSCASFLEKLLAFRESTLKRGFNNFSHALTAWRRHPH